MTAPGRHGDRSGLEWISLPHSRLGVLKRFGVYFPAGYWTSPQRLPVLYLLRGHETEWVGRQDGRGGLIPILDRAMATGRVAPMIVVMTGYMDQNRMRQGVPINWSQDGEDEGVGNGRMEDHFFEVKSWVENELRARTGPDSAALDGFSMGGFGAVMLATRYPSLFTSVGAYDGSFMFERQIDPRRKPRGRADRLWFSETCAAFFRRDGVWDRQKMERHNPATIFRHAKGARLRALRRIRFHIRAAGTERAGNLDRARHLLKVMGARGIHNSFNQHEIKLARQARHTWAWADRHIEGMLTRHDEAFRRSARDEWDPWI